MNDGDLYVVCDRTMFVSADGGRTWTPYDRDAAQQVVRRSVWSRPSIRTLIMILCWFAVGVTTCRAWDYRQVQYVLLTVAMCALAVSYTRWVSGETNRGG